MSTPTSPPSCEPRYATRRNPDRETLGPAVAAAAKALGQPLMPWQRLAVDIGCEVDDEGVPVYREVVVTVPRQNGKTTLFLAVELQRAIGWAQRLGMPQHILYTAQSGLAARKKLLNDQVPILERHRRMFGISKITKANGNESVRFANGSVIELMGSGDDAGHGLVVDLALKDELFADIDLRRDQALIPAMATRPFAQMWTASTAGTPDSVALNAKVAQGRAAVDAGRQSGICYIEYSAPPDADPGDPATWRACNPAIGHTINLAVVEHAYDHFRSQNKLGEFKRGFLNIPTLSEEQVIPTASWDLVQSATLEPVPTCFGFDCNPERTVAGIVAVGQGPEIAVADYREGTGWLVDEIASIWSRHQKPFVVDASGPAATFVPELERRNVQVVELGARDVARACGGFYDAVVNQAIAVRQDADLTAAVAAAAKRESGDAWAWTRKNSRKDICLLVAATVGVFVIEAKTDTRPVFAF